MKMLMFYTRSFWWEPCSKTIDEADEAAGLQEERDCLTAFIHVESSDGEGQARVVTRAIKNIKWLAGKFETRRIILHYFSHLSSDRSTPSCAREIVESMVQRLAAAGHEVETTPYGYTCRWGMEVVGDSLGRVFVDIGPPGGKTSVTES